MKEKEAWICSTTWRHDLCKDNAGSIRIFGSKRALLNHCECCKEDGVDPCVPVKIIIKESE